MVTRRTDPTPALADWAARCKEHGLAFTAPRKAILQTLLEADGPLDAVGVLQGARAVHPGTSLGTTYRFLRDMELHGLAHAQPQPHGRMRWRLLEQRPTDDDELRPLLQQLRHILCELERLGFADFQPSFDLPRTARTAASPHRKPFPRASHRHALSFTPHGNPPMAPHLSQRFRHDVVFRTLDVLRVERLTPHMQRVTLGGAELRGFHSPVPDNHVKLFFPNRDGQLVTPTLGPNGVEFPADLEPSPMRDYTPRHHDAERGELVIDFVLHGDGPASTWAWQAGPGQQLGIGGPRGSFVVADDFDRYVLVGDETALPAIGRWLEEMPASVRISALIEIPEASDHQPLPTRAGLDVTWLERDDRPADREGLLENALHELPAQPGDTFYWIATESRRARAMRQWLDQRGIPKDWIKASGYWKAGPDDDED